MVLCGVVWCGMVWFGVLWCGTENRALPESASAAELQDCSRTPTLDVSMLRLCLEAARWCKEAARGCQESARCCQEAARCCYMSPDGAGRLPYVPER